MPIKINGGASIKRLLVNNDNMKRAFVNNEVAVFSTSEGEIYKDGFLRENVTLTNFVDNQEFLQFSLSKSQGQTETKTATVEFDFTDFKCMTVTFSVFGSGNATSVNAKMGIDTANQTIVSKSSTYNFNESYVKTFDISSLTGNHTLIGSLTVTSAQENDTDINIYISEIIAFKESEGTVIFNNDGLIEGASLVNISVSYDNYTQKNCIYGYNSAPTDEGKRQKTCQIIVDVTKYTTISIDLTTNWNGWGGGSGSSAAAVDRKIGIDEANDWLRGGDAGYWESTRANDVSYHLVYDVSKLVGNHPIVLYFYNFNRSSYYPCESRVRIFNITGYADDEYVPPT